MRRILTVVVLATLFVTAPCLSLRTNAQGFNVNSQVTFTPVTSTYRSTSSTTGCPGGFSGQFTFTATLTNKSASPAMPGITIRVVTLTNGNVILDPQTVTVLGGTGAQMAVPKTGQYGDGLLSAGESVDVPFNVCLKSVQPFQFLVDVFGIVTQLVSVNQTTTLSGNGSSQVSAISQNGRFVVFRSSASDLVAKDTNRAADVFVRDVQTGITKLVSINQDGTDSGNQASEVPSCPSCIETQPISADGRFVVFESFASDLVSNDSNGQPDVFVRDLLLQTTTLVSVNQNGTGSGNGPSVGQIAGAAISADGRFVAFTSSAKDLAPNAANANEDIFVRDLKTATTILVTVNRFGTGTANSGSFAPRISADGRFVVFTSYATDLVSTPIPGGTNVFIRDLKAGTTTLVSVNLAGTANANSESDSRFPPSADGRFVLFHSLAANLVNTSDTNGGSDVFLRDTVAGTTTLVSLNRAGTSSGNGPSEPGIMSPNGRFVAFASAANDLVANDSNVPYRDVFVRDMQTGITTMVSINRFGTNGGNGDSSLSSISDDGRYVAFLSNASDLVTNDTNVGNSDIFVRDLQTGITTAVSVNRIGIGTGNAGSGPGVLISPDGLFVAFDSYATDLVGLGVPGFPVSNVYVRPAH